MKTTINTLRLSILFVVALCLLAGNITGQQMSSKDQLEREVYELFDYSDRLFQEMDVESLVNRFIPDGSLKLPNNNIIQGVEALSGFYSNTAQLEDFRLELRPFSVTVSESGDMAWALADFSVSFNTPGGPFNDYGVTLMVLHRVDEAWRIAAENLSSSSE